MSDEKQVIVRFPPSPTGLFHVGSARTALFNYLFARKLGGKMFFRIEDTDKERSKPEFERDMIESLAWLGLACDPMSDGKPFWRQSERSDVYKSYLKKLIDSGVAYVSKEEPGLDEDGKPKRTEVIRFKNPNKKVTFTDLIRGEISFDTTDLKDFVIARSLEEPLYHLAVVVDDAESEVTHVIRGEDGISNTPRQILLQEALGFPRPTYAHLPLLVDDARAKLSKRKHGEKVSLKHYIDAGYTSEAMVNFLALLGWHPEGEREIFSLAELVELFDISRVQKSSAIFNVEKLKWINREYLLKLPSPEREALVKDAFAKASLPEIAGNSGMIARVTPTVFERIHTVSDIETMIASGELRFLEKASYEPASLMWKEESDMKKTAERILFVKDAWSALTEESWNPENLKSAVWDFAEREGRGSVLWPTRFGLSGMQKSPDPFTVAFILGKSETLKRLGTAIEALHN